MAVAIYKSLVTTSMAMKLFGKIYTQISYIEEIIKFVRDAVNHDDFKSAKSSLPDMDFYSDGLYSLLGDTEKEHKHENN